MAGTQISDMTDEAAIPSGSFVPFVVTNPLTGLDPSINYRYDIGADLLTRVSYNALAAAGGAALVGSDDGNVQADIDARPTSATLAASAGSSLVGFLQAGTDAAPQTTQDKLRALEITPDDFAGTDTEKVQAALNRARDAGSGLVRLKRSYSITATLTIYGNTQLVGDPAGKLTWAGPTTGSILQDSSITTPTDINLNITLQDFEIDGGDVVTGDTGQVAINFYRTGNVTIRGLKVHGVGGSGIRWGLSQADTVGVLVENCEVWDCRQGDAIQGVGRAISVRNNRIGKLGSTTANFGDTGIALLYDFSPTTNPTGSYSSDAEFVDNTIIGNYDLTGTYVGIGQPIQTGIAFGPFQVGHAANVRVMRNTLFGCYLNLWPIVMDDVQVAQNNFGSHAATATGNIRFDGITNLRVQDNIITLRLAGTGADYSGILLVAQRNIYGASVFDADVSKFDISGNTISSIAAGVQGVRATFETVGTSPAYVSKLTSGLINGNSFINIASPVSLAPQTGANPATCSDVVVLGNKADGAAQRIVIAAGTAAQYANTRTSDNTTPVVIPPVDGTGGAGIKPGQIVSGVVASAGSGTPVTLLTLLSGNYVADIAARVPNQNNGDLSATARVHVNGTAARIVPDNGSAMTITNPSGLQIQATQSAGGTADITFDVEYTL